MLNLISNAIKFTDSGSVMFSCSAMKESEKKTILKIEVKDTGMGISKKNLSIIFDKFWQADNMNKENMEAQV